MKIGFFERLSRFVLIIALFTLLVTYVEAHLQEELSLMSVRTHPSIAYVWGFSLGLKDFVVENVKCIWALIRHPVSTTTEMFHAIVRIDETYAKITKVMHDTWLNYPMLSTLEKGRLHSRLVSESLYMLGAVGVPSVGISKIKIFAGLSSTRASLHPVMHRVLKPVTRLTSKNSSEIQQTIGFAEWFAYDN